MITVEIVDIFQKRVWEIEHDLRALAVNGKCEVRDGLDELSKHHLDDFKQIMVGLRLVAENKRVTNPNHVKRGKHHPEIYEIRAHKGHARLYFFYTSNDKVVVCTNSYWKAKPSKREQDGAFERAELLRQRYLESFGRQKGRT